MKRITTYKLYESNKYYNRVRADHKALEDQFLVYDEAIKHLNTLYDNVKIKHRGNRYYDIYYSIHQGDTIHIGAYNMVGKLYHLYICKSIGEYSDQGCDTHNIKNWAGELDEQSFDKFISEWNDIYDKL